MSVIDLSLKWAHHIDKVEHKGRNTRACISYTLEYVCFLSTLNNSLAIHLPESSCLLAMLHHDLRLLKRASILNSMLRLALSGSSGWRRGTRLRQRQIYYSNEPQKVLQPTSHWTLPQVWYALQPILFMLTDSSFHFYTASPAYLPATHHRSVAVCQAGSRLVLLVKQLL